MGTDRNFLKRGVIEKKNGGEVKFRSYQYLMTSLSSFIIVQKDPVLHLFD